MCKVPEQINKKTTLKWLRKRGPDIEQVCPVYA